MELNKHVESAVAKRINPKTDGKEEKKKTYEIQNNTIDYIEKYLWWYTGVVSYVYKSNNLNPRDRLYILCNRLCKNRSEFRLKPQAGKSAVS